MAISIFSAVINGRINSVKFCAAINAGADINEHFGEKQMTILMIAVKTQNKSTTKNLIERPGLEVDAVDSDGKTALIHAAQHGPMQTCLDLLRAGANIDHADLVGNTPLMYCRDYYTVDTLLHCGANINVKNHRGKTPLMVYPNDRIALLLLRRGIAINIQDQNGFTELMLAVKNDSTYRINLLICYGANPRITDRDGRTALMHAEITGDRDKIKLFENYDNYQRGVADIPENNGEVNIFVRSIAHDDDEIVIFKNRLMPYYAQVRPELVQAQRPMDLDIPPAGIKPAEVKTDNIAIQCIVCMENQRSVIFNCGHLIVCEECSDRIRNVCPMCNTRITKKNKVFLS